KRFDLWTRDSSRKTGEALPRATPCGGRSRSWRARRSGGRLSRVSFSESEEERLQAFEGVVIRKRGGGASASFTVRRISYGVGVERTFPLHSPRIDKGQVTKRAAVRRSKLYYLRDLAGKAARLKEKRIAQVPSSGEQQA